MRRAEVEGLEKPQRAAQAHRLAGVGPRGGLDFASPVHLRHVRIGPAREGAVEARAVRGGATHVERAQLVE